MENHVSSQKGRISNADQFLSKAGPKNETIAPPFIPPLKDTQWTKEKVLKIVFAAFLFFLITGSGLVSRITLHILIWHLQPPTSTTAIASFGAILRSNCTKYTSGNESVHTKERNMVDISWIWALFVIIVAPYFLTFFSTLFRICFKSNKQLEWKVLLLVLLVETSHTVGLSMLAFVVLPSFDPASASVVYMSVAVIPAAIDLIDTASASPNKGKESKIFIRKSKLAFLFFPLVGLIFQLVGIILVGTYIEQNRLIGMYVVGSILVSIKYWENFISLEGNRFASMREIKRKHQEGRTKISCLTSMWKICLTFLAVISIFTAAAKNANSMDVLKTMFGNGQSDLELTNRTIQIGNNQYCYDYVPYVVALINIIADYLCYKAVKSICVINCQRLGVMFLLFVLPVATVFALIGLMFNPELLKFTSCDVFFSNWCIQTLDGLEDKFYMMIGAFIMFYLSLILICKHVLNVNGYRHGETSRIFVSPFYCGVFLDISLLLNRRREDKEYDAILNKTEESIPTRSSGRKMLYACCATMWHETENEMKQILKSVFRLDMRQYKNNLIAEKIQGEDDENDIETFDLEAQVFFDDAFEPLKDGKKFPYVNEYVKTFTNVIEEAGSIVHGKRISVPPGEMYRTPYGGRLHYELPGGNELIIHLKDKTKIRHKKRWSQVMYMFYILQWKLEREFKKEDLQIAAENTYILALDGDVDFEPEAVLSLMRRMNKSKIVGAACGRIHPIGTGPMVWYQKFEYAISHWLQKATEHVIGCVLCSPGCFSLFRGSAILHADVLETYTTVPTEAQHVVQYDQGEDRWLCTLLLKEGWRVEYCAESDAYTFAPESFYEFYNQRRRWSPSTMANILDLIVDWKNVTKKNENISFLYIAYHVFLFISTLLTPGTIFMLILGAIIVGFEAIPPWLSLILNLVPVGVFLLMCLYASTQRQLQFAAILSCIYSIVMAIVLIGVIRDAVNDGLCSVTTIFIMFVASVFVISAILHPQEFLCLIPGLLYFLAIPSMCMLMFLYSIGNLHVVSWGTRETKQEPDTKNQKAKETPEIDEKGYFCSLGSFCSCIVCPTNNYTQQDFLYNNMLNKMKKLMNIENRDSVSEVSQDQTFLKQTHKETDDIQNEGNADTENKGEEVKIQPTDVNQTKNNGEYCLDKKYPVIEKKERKFWKKIIKQYLKPLEKNPQKEKAIEQDLIELRNKVCLFVFLLNAILVTVMFGLTQVNTFKNSLTIYFPCDGKSATIVPIAVLFAVVFGLLLLLQFLCMLYHRFSTLVHIAASTNIKDSQKTKNTNFHNQMADLMTKSVIDPQPQQVMTSDKDRTLLDKNRSMIMSFTDRNKTKFAHLSDVVDENQKILRQVVTENQKKLSLGIDKKKFGDYYIKNKDSEVSQKVLNRWASFSKSKPKSRNETEASIINEESTEQIDLEKQQQISNDKMFEKRRRPGNKVTAGVREKSLHVVSVSSSDEDNVDKPFKRNHRKVKIPKGTDDKV
ncbi:chitin synthase chs-2-like [Mytilus edulis]|uniref:chitin synthase chs-2-like n=1 Tax=Mytilus edulis TaxID=6550 RepID=UPI0039EFE93E